MKFVTDENAPISWAAKLHSVLKLTLRRYTSGNLTHGDKPGSDQLLSPAEEEKLSNFLVKVA